jgi:hypothetical protein
VTMIIDADDDVMRDQRAMTIKEFCDVENISKATYYKMRRAGFGPEETTVPIPGMNVIRISAAARHAWHVMLAEQRQTKSAELERKRQQAQRVRAAKRAAKSPLHVSRRTRQDRRK